MKKIVFIVIMSFLVFFTACSERRGNPGIPTSDQLTSNPIDSENELDSTFGEKSTLTAEEERYRKELFDEMDLLDKESEQIEKYGSIGASAFEEKIQSMSSRLSELGKKYFALTESFSDPEVQNLAVQRNSTARYIGFYVKAKRRAELAAQLTNEYRRLYDQWLYGEGSPDRSVLFPILEQMSDLGISTEGYSPGKLQLQDFAVTSFEDNDDFAELMEKEGFTILKTGTGILASGVDGQGREWRVVGDRPDANLSKLAFVVRDPGKEWRIEKTSEARDAHMGVIGLDIGKNNYNDYNYGAVDPQEKTLYTTKCKEIHLFMQGQGAKRPIWYDLLVGLLPKNCAVQLWQNGEYYLIHLVYYGSWGDSDELSRRGLTDLYYTLKGMGVFEAEKTVSE